MAPERCVGSGYRCERCNSGISTKTLWTDMRGGLVASRDADQELPLAQEGQFGNFGEDRMDRRAGRVDGTPARRSADQGLPLAQEAQFGNFGKDPMDRRAGRVDGKPRRRHVPRRAVPGARGAIREPRQRPCGPPRSRVGGKPGDRSTDQGAAIGARGSIREFRQRPYGPPCSRLGSKSGRRSTEHRGSLGRARPLRRGRDWWQHAVRKSAQRPHATVWRRGPWPATPVPLGDPAGEDGLRPRHRAGADSRGEPAMTMTAGKGKRAFRKNAQQPHTTVYCRRALPPGACPADSPGGKDEPRRRYRRGQMARSGWAMTAGAGMVAARFSRKRAATPYNSLPPVGLGPRAAALVLRPGSEDEPRGRHWPGLRAGVRPAVADSRLAWRMPAGHDHQ